MMYKSLIYLFQVKAFSRSLESFRTAIVVGGTNMAEQVQQDEKNQGLAKKRKMRRRVGRTSMNYEQTIIAANVYMSWFKNSSSIVCRRRNKHIKPMSTMNVEHLMEIPPVALISGLLGNGTTKIHYPPPLLELWMRSTRFQSPHDSPSRRTSAPQPPEPVSSSGQDRVYQDPLEFPVEDFHSGVGSHPKQLSIMMQMPNLDNIEFPLNEVNQMFTPGNSGDNDRSIQSSASGNGDFLPLDPEAQLPSGPSGRSNKKRPYSSSRHSGRNLAPVAEENPWEFPEPDFKLRRLSEDELFHEHETLVETGPTPTQHPLVDHPIDKITEAIRKHPKTHFETPGAPQIESLDQLANGMNWKRAAQLFYQTCVRGGVNIVVTTTGRFIDHFQQGNTSLSRISFVVLDEADRMLDMGFEPQIREHIKPLSTMKAEHLVELPSVALISGLLGNGTTKIHYPQPLLELWMKSIKFLLGARQISAPQPPKPVSSSAEDRVYQDPLEFVKAFSKSLESFRTAIVLGGTNMAEQRSELRAGVNIVVATPGRFIDHLQQGNTSLSRISFVVLDEADRMLDMWFEPQIREHMEHLMELPPVALISVLLGNGTTKIHYPPPLLELWNRRTRFQSPHDSHSRRTSAPPPPKPVSSLAQDRVLQDPLQFARLLTRRFCSFSSVPHYGGVSASLCLSVSLDTNAAHKECDRNGLRETHVATMAALARVGNEIVYAGKGLVDVVLPPYSINPDVQLNDDKRHARTDVYEMQIMLIAVLRLLRLGYRKIYLQSDSRNAVRMIKGDIQPNVHHEELPILTWLQPLSALHRSGHVVFNNVRRERIMATDRMTQIIKYRYLNLTKYKRSSGGARHLSFQDVSEDNLRRDWRLNQYLEDDRREVVYSRGFQGY